MNAEQISALKRENNRILKATLAAFVVSLVILFTLVLPAEFDFDPLGTGQALGIFGLSSTAEVQTVSTQEATFYSDKVEYVLQPYESIEYKYRLTSESTMIYAWVSSGTVTFDFHGEPHDGPEGFAESYSVGKGDAESGAFTAPFTGIHGWFWENRGSDVVTVTLKTSGFYSATLEFRDGFVNEKAVP